MNTQFNLKKSLFVTTAVLGAVAGAEFSANQTAQASTVKAHTAKVTRHQTTKKYHVVKAFSVKTTTKHVGKKATVRGHYTKFATKKHAVKELNDGSIRRQTKRAKKLYQKLYLKMTSSKRNQVAKKFTHRTVKVTPKTTQSAPVSNANVTPATTSNQTATVSSSSNQPQSSSDNLQAALQSAQAKYNTEMNQTSDSAPVSASAQANTTQAIPVSVATSSSSATSSVASSFVETDAQKAEVLKNTTTSTTYSGADTRVAPWEGTHAAKVVKGNIYYYNAESDATVRDTYEQAIQAWNNLGVVHLVPQSSQAGAAIILADNINVSSVNPYIKGYGDEEYGSTWLNTNNDADTGDIVTVNPHAIMTDGTDKNEMLESMEHEIGHALGFAHDQFTTTGQTTTNTEAFDSTTGQLKPITVTTAIPVAQPIMMSGRTASSDDNGLIQLGQAEKNALIAHYGTNGAGLSVNDVK